MSKIISQTKSLEIFREIFSNTMRKISMCHILCGNLPFSLISNHLSHCDLKSICCHEHWSTSNYFTICILATLMSCLTSRTKCPCSYKDVKHDLKVDIIDRKITFEEDNVGIKIVVQAVILWIFKKRIKYQRKE